MQVERNYQRKYLRAPYKEPVLYQGDGFVFKAHTLNISQGGLLLDQIPFFPDMEVVPMMLSLPQHPYFKNFNLSKLESFNNDLFAKKIVRVNCQIVRKLEIESVVDEVFTSRIGLKFIELDEQTEKKIIDYVNVFSSNLIYLQVLMDSLNADSQNLAKTRALSSILKYQEGIKISELRKQVMHDYKSLQWP
jgi:c-di-GMP-binding flagellar brake protein YcgR